jgi:hypothetical protein
MSRLPRWPLLGLLVLLLIRGWWQRTDTRPVPAPQPLEQVEIWMLQALPGIGPATAADCAEALRNGRLEQLPQSVQALAQELFSVHAVVISPGQPNSQAVARRATP